LTKNERKAVALWKLAHLIRNTEVAEDKKEGQEYAAAEIVKAAFALLNNQNLQILVQDEVPFGAEDRNVLND